MSKLGYQIPNYTYPGVEPGDLFGAVVAQAKADAQEAAEAAKAELERSIARRLQSAEDQIASAEASAVKEVRDSAIEVAIGAAQDVIAGGMGGGDADDLIDASIKIVDAKLH